MIGNGSSGNRGCTVDRIPDAGAGGPDTIGRGGVVIASCVAAREGHASCIYEVVGLLSVARLGCGCRGWLLLSVVMLVSDLRSCGGGFDGDLGG